MEPGRGGAENREMKKKNNLKVSFFFFFLPGSLLSFLQMLSWTSAAGSLTNVGKSANLSWLLVVQGQRGRYVGVGWGCFQYGSWFSLACLGTVG